VPGVDDYEALITRVHDALAKMPGAGNIRK
jgi:hypothetical protein